MAYLTLNIRKLRHNYEYLNRLFRKKRITWSVVSKLLCGNKLYLNELLRLAPKQICDARIGHLRAIKKLNPKARTIYIRPVPARVAAAVVRYADISFNTQYRTLELLSEEAVRQRKTHKVILMVELGERREGIMPAQIPAFYEKARQLPHIEIIGLGANFACLSGILPSRSKLEELVKCREILAVKFGKRLTWISGGSSVVIPLLFDRELPRGINHLRIGETLFFGTNVYKACPLEGIYQDVFILYAQIIELIRKPLKPDGEIGYNLEGHTPEFDNIDNNQITWRAIVDVGLLDVESSHLIPVDPSIECIGASSDMLVVNLGANPNGYRTGDHLEFGMNYMGALRLMNSRYITKQVVTDPEETA